MFIVPILFSLGWDVLTYNLDSMNPLKIEKIDSYFKSQFKCKQRRFREYKLWVSINRGGKNNYTDNNGVWEFFDFKSYVTQKLFDNYRWWRILCFLSEEILEIHPIFSISKSKILTDSCKNLIFIQYLPLKFASENKLK